MGSLQTLSYGTGGGAPCNQQKGLLVQAFFLREAFLGVTEATEYRTLRLREPPVCTCFPVKRNNGFVD
jgi:hypothetical protein